MNEQELLRIILPAALVSSPRGFKAVVTFHLTHDQDTWYLAGQINKDGQEISDRLLLEPEDIIDVLEGTLDIDHYCQDEPFRQHQVDLAKRLSARVAQDDPIQTLEVQLEPYRRQQHVLRKKGVDYLKLLLEECVQKKERPDIPPHLCASPPEGYIPDQRILSAALQRLYEGQACTAILGPTGSGKSAMARYIGARLNQEGWGVHVVDASARLEGDRLFDRDDFDPSGTFVLEGVLCRLARESKEKGLKLLIVLEEYNAFTDETRREFYRLFSDQDRFYPIQSSKDNKLIDRVDFAHVQFLITANPLTSDKYLTDDLKRLSNAEIRRMVVLYLDYAQDEETLRSIFQTLIRRKPGYRLLKAKAPDFEEAINWQLGVDLFRELNRRTAGEDLGYDVGYSAVADVLWTAALRSHQSEGLTWALTEHILNGISDIGIRTVAADRIRQAIGVEMPTDLVLQDA